MSPSSTLPLSEAIEYFGVNSVSIDALILAVKAGEDAEENAPEISVLKGEIEELRDEAEALEDKLAQASERIVELELEVLDMKAAQ